MVSSGLRCMFLGAVAMSVPALSLAATLKLGGQVQDTYKKPFELYVAWAASQTGTGAYTVTSSIKTYDASTMASDLLKMTTASDATYVDAVICPYTSGLSKKCADAVNKDYTGPVFVWGGANEAIFDTNCAALPNKNCFGLFTVGGKYMESGLVALAAQTSGTAAKVSTIANNNGFSASVCAGANTTVAAQSMLTQQSYTKLSLAKAAPKAVDVAAIASALAMKPDIVVICGHNKDVEPVIVQIGKSSHMPKAIIATNGLSILSNYAGSDSKYAKCVMMPTQWDFTAVSKDPVMGWDSAAFTAAMGGAATYQQATAGGVVVALANAMKAANNDVAHLRNKLAIMNVDSFYGKLNWDAAGRIQKPMFTQQMQGSEMKIILSVGYYTHYPLALPTCWGNATAVETSSAASVALSTVMLMSLIFVGCMDLDLMK